MLTKQESLNILTLALANPDYLGTPEEAMTELAKYLRVAGVEF